ncbi:hypothetical protein [Alkaliphilus crotonatoxidans]
MKLKDVFYFILMLTVILTLSGIQVFAEAPMNFGDNWVMFSSEDERDLHTEKDSAMVIYSEGEVLFKLHYDTAEFTEELVSEIAKDTIIENYVKNENAIVEPQVVTCCSNPIWRDYIQENHTRRGNTCYVDVYDRYICNNCGTSYREYSHSYSHSAASCPYL